MKSVRHFFLFFFLCVCSYSTFSQQLPYLHLLDIRKADSLFSAKKFKEAALAFNTAFSSNGQKGKIDDRYKAARAWALAGYPDSAVFQLDRIIQKAYFSDYDRLINEADFNVLHSDERWQKLAELVRQNSLFNFGFERLSGLGKFPLPWFKWGSAEYRLSADSVEKHSGNYSLLIKPVEEIYKKTFGCAAYYIPAKYKGNEMQVSAYLKLENVDGYAGLLLRLDNAEHKTIEFENMSHEGINGTKDWKKYSVRLQLSEKATTIYIGVILSGTGRLWADDFELLIDGKPLERVPLKEK